MDKIGKDKIIGLSNFSSHFIGHHNNLEMCVKDNIALKDFKKMLVLRLEISQKKNAAK